MEGLTELALVFVFSLLGLIAAVRLRLPPVMGILLAGALAGPNALGWIQSGTIVNLFSELGAILLLFVIGIEFSLAKIMKFGVRAIIIAFIKVTFVFAVVYAFCVMLGMTPLEALIVGNIFAVTSTTLFSKLVKGSLDENKEEVNLMFAVLILEDILSVFFLSVISALPSATVSSLVLNDILFSIVKSLVVLVIAYVVMQKVVQAFFSYILKYKTEELMVFSAFSVCALFAFLSSAVGLEASIGAFLAGSIIASLREFKKIEKIVLPFGLFFSSFFFLSIGIMVNFNSLASNLLLIVLLLGVSMLAKFVSVGAGTYLMGFNSKSAIFSGLTMLTVGEFSLLIAKKSQMLVGFDIIGVVSVCVFLSAFSSALMMRREHMIDSLVTTAIPVNMRVSGRNISHYIHEVVVQFEPNGKFFKVAMREIRSIVFYSLAFLLLNGSLLLLESLLETFGIMTFQTGAAFWGRFLLHAAISLALLWKVMSSLDILITGFISAFRKKDAKNVPLERRVIYDGVTVLLLLAAATLFPLLFAFAGLPAFLGSVSAVFLVFGIIYAWDAAKCTHQLVLALSKKRKTFHQKPLSHALMGLAMFLNL